MNTQLGSSKWTDSIWALSFFLIISPLKHIRFFKQIYFYLFLAVLDLPCCAGFSLVVVSRLYSLLGCEGFSLRWLLLLGSIGSRACGFPWWHVGSEVVIPRLPSTGPIAVAHGLRFSSARGIFPDQDQTVVPCIGRWIPYSEPPDRPPAHSILLSLLLLPLADCQEQLKKTK